MSQWDKLIESILSEDASLRFDEIYKALVKFGYSANQPHGGSSLILSGKKDTHQ